MASITIDTSMAETTGIRFRISYLDDYRKILEKCYQALKQDNSYPNKISFGITAVAYIEYACNMLITDFCENNFEKTISGTYATYFTRFEIKTKVELLVAIVTHYKFIADKGHNTIQALIKLIGIRNTIVHKKDTYEHILGPMDETTPPIFFTASASDENLERLTQLEVDRFYNAALNFVANTTEEYDKTCSLKPVEFIISNPKNNV